MKTLIIKFKKESQLSSKSTAQETPQLPFEYHKCTVYSTSFSSINQLLNHNQMVTCGKSSCNHCEEIFDSKNKLHDHVRNHECATTSSSAIKITRPITTSTSATKSISSHKSNLSALTPIENIALKTTITLSSPLPTYRSVSPPSPTYEPYKKPYLTIADLYMRYAPLSKLQARNKATRIMIILPTMSMQDLYKKFHDKEKPIIPIPNKTLDSPTKQHATRQNLGHAVFERFGFIRCPKSDFSLSSKPIAQRLTVQQQRHIKSFKHGALPNICIGDVRKHTMSPVDPVVAVKTPARYRTCDIPAEKGMNTSAEHMRCSNKV